MEYRNPIPTIKRTLSSNAVSSTIEMTCSLPNSLETTNGTKQLQLDQETFNNRSHVSLHSSRRFIIQNFVLIWLDSSINEIDDSFCNSVAQLRQIVHIVDTFTDPDQCIDFITEIKDEKAFLIVSGALGQQLTSLIHDIPQLYSIYVFGGDRTDHEMLANKWSKVRGVFVQIESICDLLKQETKQCNRDLTPVTIAAQNAYSKRDLNELEPSFMYSQMLKELLLDVEHDEHAKEEMNQLWREQYHSNEFQDDYHRHSPIWWYTRDCFIYELLNRALRLLEVNILLKMGFFIRDLHQQIEQLYKRPTEKLTVYRGQGLLNTDFEKIRTREGGLLSFNSFLSTSTKRSISLFYAECSRENFGLIGILFQVNMYPAIQSSPFAPLENVSYFSDTEQEILFSMHTVFRIGETKPIGDRLWQVELSITSDEDQELKKLTEHIREEIKGGTGWHQMGQLLIRTGNFEKAEEIYQVLLEKTSKSNENELGHLYYQLGWANGSRGDYREASEFYQKSLEIYKKCLPPYHPNLATNYNNIGQLHDKMGEYSKALDFYHKTLEIYEKVFPSYHPHVATVCNNIGLVHMNMGQHSKALEFYKRSFEIKLKSLPSNHPSLATTYSNTATVLNKMGEYSKALEYYQKSLEIEQKALLPNHPSLAITYNNIGLAYDKTGEYSKALDFYKKALEIQQKSLSSNHEDLAITYNNIGLMHKNMGEYSKALEFYHKSLEVYQESLPPNHPYLAQTYNNIGTVHCSMKDYSKALEIYQKSLEIKQASLHPTHPDVAVAHYCIGFIHYSTGEYSKALSLFERAVEIGQHSLPENHPHLQLYRKYLDELGKKLVSVASDEVNM